MDPLFVIAAGGTGAKVAEALIHLCAAGLGPEEVQMLLVDVDVTNGNRARTEDTFDCYQQIQAWPWTVRTTDNGGVKEIRLFHSRIHLYSLARGVDSVNQSGLLPQIRGDDELVQAMRVLLDEDELVSDLSHGFTGRPNLGSLVMDRHLRAHLTQRTPSRDGRPNEGPRPDRENRPGADEFMAELINSARAASSNPRVAAVGSVFGGTGASLLPVIKSCIKAQFDRGDGSGQPIHTLFDSLHWAKVMQLPYFAPQPGPTMRQVNPHRHLMDTASALWYYGLQDEPEGGITYLIGSERREDRETSGCDGGDKQKNPPFYHEILSALAILDFYYNPTPTAGESVRHLGNRSVGERCELGRLPTPHGMARKDFLEHLALLFHLAAFALLDAEEGTDFKRGLFQYAQGARLTGWDSALHGRFVSEKFAPHDPANPANHALHYFGRLLLWAAPTLSSQFFRSAGLVFDARADYVSLHNTLCHISDSEVCVGEDGQPFREADDHFTARLCRSAIAALLREGTRQRPHEFGAPATLVENSQYVRVGIPEAGVARSLRRFRVLGSDEKLASLCQDYNTAPPEALQPKTLSN